MADLIYSFYEPPGECKCCYSREGCSVTFELVCEQPNRGARPAYKIYFEGPSPCIGTQLLMDVPGVPAVVPAANPPDPGCEGFACQGDCGATITEAITFGPIVLPIGCCDCTFDMCIRDVTPMPVIPDGCEPHTGYPTNNFGCSNDVLYMKKDGVTLKGWSIGIDLIDFIYMFTDIDTFEYGVCLTVDMYEFCNPAP